MKEKFIVKCHESILGSNWLIETGVNEEKHSVMQTRVTYLRHERSQEFIQGEWVEEIAYARQFSTYPECIGAIESEIKQVNSPNKIYQIEKVFIN